MALPNQINNWEKTHEDKKHIEYENDKGQKVTITDVSGKPLVRGTWFVRILDYDGIKTKDFTGSKSQALSFAKQYMRTH